MSEGREPREGGPTPPFISDLLPLTILTPSQMSRSPETPTRCTLSPRLRSRGLSEDPSAPLLTLGTFDVLWPLRVGTDL